MAQNYLTMTFLLCPPYDIIIWAGQKFRLTLYNCSVIVILTMNNQLVAKLSFPKYWVRITAGEFCFGH